MVNISIRRKNKKKSCKNKTIKKRDNCNGVCVLHKNDNNINGSIHLFEKTNGVFIKYNIEGLSDGEHGFHIHTYGDLTDGCNSACAHYNPLHKKHGGLHSKERHLGDLGNITSKNKISKGSLLAKNVSLTKKHPIIGRMLIIHKDKDDLGRGHDEESSKTGNAGKRLACGVIGLCS